MNVTISKPGGVIVENTQQPTGFYPSKHIERNHPEMVNSENMSGEGPLQNIYYTDRYAGRDKYDGQRNDIVKNNNQLGSEVDSRRFSDNCCKEDIEKINPRGSGQVKTNFRRFGQVKPNINKIDKYIYKVPFEYLKEDYEKFGHDMLRKQFEWLKSVTPDLFTYVISEVNLETNEKFSGDSMQSDDTCEDDSEESESHDETCDDDNEETESYEFRKYEKYSGYTGK